MTVHAVPGPNGGLLERYRYDSFGNLIPDDRAASPRSTSCGTPPCRKP